MTHAPCWRHDCEQTACVDQRRRYKKRWRYEADSRGARRTIPADQAIAHIERCKAAGMDAAQIGRAANLPPSTVTKLARQHPKRVRKTTADAILAVTPNRWVGTHPGTLVPRIGARRRLQALMAQGHSINRLERERGEQYSVMVYRASPGDLMTLDNYRKIVALYDELSMTIGDSTRSRNDAAKRGYAPPLAWDDDTIDDPDAEPNYGRHELGYSNRKLPDADVLVAEVNRSGSGVVAKRYGVNRKTVSQSLKRAGYRASSTGDTRQMPTYMREDDAA